MSDIKIRIFETGNPGNILAMYLTALKIKEYLPSASISHVDLPLFNIHCPDFDLGSTMGGLHDRFHNSGKRYSIVPVKGFAKWAMQTDAAFISLEGLCQNIKNFPDRYLFNYDQHFPFSDKNTSFGGENDLVINIRGGEVLQGVSTLYPMIPIEFYKFLAQKTKKHLIFYGQLDDSPYMEELKSTFPNATYIASRGMEMDFDFLRKSKHLVMCISTFSWFAAWFSNAQKIYFPIAGTLNPAQHFYGNMLPLDDPRYEFFLFPVYDALPVKRYREYIDPVRNAWQHVSHDQLRGMMKRRSSNIEDYLLAFDPEFYISHYHECRNIYNTWGNKGVVNFYLETGFFRGDFPCYVDRSFYTQNYPLAALEISQGIFENEVEHYILRGQYQGYKPHAGCL
ncbi:hypothetical protein [Acetobacter sp. A11-2]|uniref:hypothetical protein n=1 Tax=Acetobacter sp. A11-2 TaxID=3157859 RepID=UPI0032EFCB8A